MCDRTKQEILARELAYTFYRGTQETFVSYPSPNHFVDKHYETFMKWAKDTLQTLEKHKDEQTSKSTTI